MHSRLICWISILLLICPSSHAAIYKEKSPSGEIIYSDRPTPSSEEVITETPNSTELIVAPSTTPTAKEKREADNQSIRYQVSITSPQNESTYTNEIVTVNLVLDISPQLRKGHQLQLYHQGVALGKAQRQKKFVVQNLPRGAHQFYVEVINASGRSMGQSQTITVFQKRASIHLPNNPHNPN